MKKKEKANIRQHVFLIENPEVRLGDPNG
jgi:hypothetical protein